MDHWDTLIGENSINILKKRMVRKNIELKCPRSGSWSYLKPMIDENKDSVINQLEATNQEVKGCQLDEFQLELYNLLSSYKDLLYTNELVESVEDIQKVYVLHVLQHLMNSRAKIISNNKVFEKKTISESVLQDDPRLRDQGFTRAKVLFLVPFRFSALRLGKCIVKLLGETFNSHHLDRFIKEFGDEDGIDSTLRPVASDTNKSSDYFHTFHGNTDDAFRVGLKLTRKSVKFFADFYDSDIIIASPLGLKTILTPHEQEAIKVSNKQNADIGQSDQVGADADFLSSIEIMVLDQADIFLMQNWEHLLDIMGHINSMPKKPRKMDVARIRQYHLEDWSKYYRQLIMFSSISVPLIHGFFQAHSLNYQGYLSLKHRVESPQAKQVSSRCKQHFLYYESATCKDACDDRYSFFIKQVLPKFIRPHITEGADKALEGNTQTGALDHTLIVVSSYFDYVRLRNYFRREKLSFTQICEYTEDNKVAKARQLFYFGARQFLLYTERCHFYHRYKIKGVRRIIFYEPPIYAKFYSELVDFLIPELQGKKFVDHPSQFMATTLFSNHDTLQLGALIGYTNAVKLIENKKSVL